MKTHKVTCIRFQYFITCGKCGKEFEETGENQLAHAYPKDIDGGEWIECPNCKEELQVEFEE